jgi:hypothetical protein
MKHFHITFIFALLFFASCTAHQPKENIVQNNFDFAAKQLAFAITQVDSALAANPLAAERMLVVPRSTDHAGALRLVASRDWTSGFFPGSLWFMYEFTGDEKWKTEARRFTAKIEREKYNATTHDMGFKIFCSFGKGYRLTNDAHYREVLLYSARTLTTRYNPVVGAIRSWDHSRERHGDFPVIIDNMMNLELLFWAFRETGDSIFYNISVNHAMTTIREHFRPDFGTYHVIGFDPETGEVTLRHTHQGYANETTWARGQAWAIYGFVLMYRETRRPEFLEVAKNAVNMFFMHPNLPECLIPFWDFDAPGIPDQPRDVSAAAITASALYELSTYCAVNGAQYRKWADTIIRNLTKYHRAEYGTYFGFLLLNSTGHKPHGYEIDVPLVYADYYFLEALLRKKRLERGERLFR